MGLKLVKKQTKLIAFLGSKTNNYIMNKVEIDEKIGTNLEIFAVKKKITA